MLGAAFGYDTGPFRYIFVCFVLKRRSRRFKGQGKVWNTDLYAE
jgi:hypothetical protein